LGRGGASLGVSSPNRFQALAMNDDRACFKCHSSAEAPSNQILLCDGLGCVACYHQQCLEVSLHSIPRSDWMCPVCVASGNVTFRPDGVAPDSVPAFFRDIRDLKDPLKRRKADDGRWLYHVSFAAAGKVAGWAFYPTLLAVSKLASARALVKWPNAAKDDANAVRILESSDGVGVVDTRDEADQLLDELNNSNSGSDNEPGGRVASKRKRTRRSSFSQRKRKRQLVSDRRIRERCSLNFFLSYLTL